MREKPLAFAHILPGGVGEDVLDPPGKTRLHVCNALLIDIDIAGNLKLIVDILIRATAVVTPICCRRCGEICKGASAGSAPLCGEAAGAAGCVGAGRAFGHNRI